MQQNDLENLSHVKKKLDDIITKLEQMEVSKKEAKD